MKCINESEVNSFIEYHPGFKQKFKNDSGTLSSFLVKKHTPKERLRLFLLELWRSVATFGCRLKSKEARDRLCFAKKTKIHVLLAPAKASTSKTLASEFQNKMIPQTKLVSAVKEFKEKIKAKAPVVFLLNEKSLYGSDQSCCQCNLTKLQELLTRNPELKEITLKFPSNLNSNIKEEILFLIERGIKFNILFDEIYAHHDLQADAFLTMLGPENASVFYQALTSSAKKLFLSTLAAYSFPKEASQILFKSVSDEEFTNLILDILKDSKNPKGDLTNLVNLGQARHKLILEILKAHDRKVFELFFIELLDRVYYENSFYLSPYVLELSPVAVTDSIGCFCKLVIAELSEEEITRFFHLIYTLVNKPTEEKILLFKNEWGLRKASFRFEIWLLFFKFAPVDDKTKIFLKRSLVKSYLLEDTSKFNKENLIHKLSSIEIAAMLEELSEKLEELLPLVSQKQQASLVQTLLDQKREINPFLLALLKNGLNHESITAWEIASRCPLETQAGKFAFIAINKLSQTQKEELMKFIIAQESGKIELLSLFLRCIEPDTPFGLQLKAEITCLGEIKYPAISCDRRVLTNQKLEKAFINHPIITEVTLIIPEKREYTVELSKRVDLLLKYDKKVNVEFPKDGIDYLFIPQIIRLFPALTRNSQHHFMLYGLVHKDKEIKRKIISKLSPIEAKEFASFLLTQKRDRIELLYDLLNLLPKQDGVLESFSQNENFEALLAEALHSLKKHFDNSKIRVFLIAALTSCSEKQLTSLINTAKNTPFILEAFVNLFSKPSFEKHNLKLVLQLSPYNGAIDRVLSSTIRQNAALISGCFQEILEGGSEVDITNAFTFNYLDFYHQYGTNALPVKSINTVQKLGLILDCLFLDLKRYDPISKDFIKVFFQSDLKTYEIFQTIKRHTPLTNVNLSEIIGPNKAFSLDYYISGEPPADQYILSIVRYMQVDCPEEKWSSVFVNLVTASKDRKNLVYSFFMNVSSEKIFTIYFNHLGIFEMEEQENLTSLIFFIKELNTAIPIYGQQLCERKEDLEDLVVARLAQVLFAADKLEDSVFARKAVYLVFEKLLNRPHSFYSAYEKLPETSSLKSYCIALRDIFEKLIILDQENHLEHDLAEFIKSASIENGLALILNASSKKVFFENLLRNYPDKREFAKNYLEAMKNRDV